MVASLRGIRAVLKDGGRLVLDSRNWEKLRRDRPRFQVMGVRDRAGVRCTPLYVWSFPDRWEVAHMIEVVLIFDEQGRTSCRSYPVTYYPFRFDALLERLSRAGFVDVQSDYASDVDSYVVTATVRRGS